MAGESAVPASCRGGRQPAVRARAAIPFTARFARSATRVPAIIDKVMRAGEGKLLRKLARIAEQVNSIEADFEKHSDAELREMTGEFRQRYADGESLDDLLPEAFATVREAAKRTLGQRPATSPR
jgi:hypothetical protein